MKRGRFPYSVQSSRHRRTCDRDPQAITRGTPREIRLDAVHAQLAEVRGLTRVTSGAWREWQQ